jgi:hypothetical protein
MFSTTYQNNQRIVSGNVPVFNDDVVLLCNTSTAAVTINLSEISANYWNTTWKLYVNDNSNNAATNNITINAGSGQTINGLSSLTINTNGGQALIRVSSNSSFIAELSSGGGSSLTVKDEGTTIATGVNIMNFIGAAVSVTTPSSGQANVTINANGYQILSNAALLTLIGSSSLNIGWTYIVNDVTNADTFVSIQAISTNGVQNYGAGYFLNADYQAVGNYSGVSGFVSQTGIWKGSTGTYVVGDICIWNNLHYKNITGSNSSTTPNSDTTNWQVLTKSATNGYILAVDYVTYDVNSNLVRKRVDSKNNEVDYEATFSAFSNFQWGRDEVTYNKVLNGSAMQCVNSPCTFTGNFLINSRIIDSTPALSTGGTYISNILTNSRIQITSNQGEVSYNNLDSGSYFEIVNIIKNSGYDTPIVTCNNFKENSYLSINTLQRGTASNQSEPRSSLSYNNFYSESYILTVGSVIIVDSRLNRNNFSSVSYLRILNSVNLCNIYESNVEGRSYISVTGAYTGNVRNNVLSVNSYLTLDTGVGSCDCSGNRLFSFSYMTIGDNSGQIDNNILTNGSSVQITTNQNNSYVSANTLENNSSLLLTTGQGATRLRYNTIDNSTLSIGTISNNFQYNHINSTPITVTTCTGNFNENIFESSTLTLTTNNSTYSENYAYSSTINITTNNSFTLNTLIDATATIVTNGGTITANTFNSGYLSISGSIDSGSDISYNEVTTNGIITISDACTNLSISYCNISLSGQFNLGGVNTTSTYSNLFISNSGVLQTLVFVSSNITKCEVIGSVTIDLGSKTSAAYQSLSYRIGFSNWISDLDLSDPAIFSGGTTVTVPTTLGVYVGNYTLVNCGGITIDTILNLTTNHPITFTIGDSTIIIGKIPTASAASDMIVGLQSLSTLTATYTYRSSISDNFVVQKLTQGLGCLSLFEENIYA